MTVRETITELRERLSPIYGYDEARAMIRLIFNNLKGWDTTDLLINEDQPVSDYIRGKIVGILARLLKNEPIQYILGEARFYGMTLKVDRSTLIPRHETEELVDIIVDENKESDLRVLDICTGSGAIAIALARNLLFPKVSALDISPDAVKIAEENARDLHADINFFVEDVFRYEPEPDSFDIIVSNPPYVDESEKSDMELNVLEYEPSSALFVPDDNPLVFYSRIFEIATTALSARGKIYLEINPRHASDLRTLASREGFHDIRIIKDISQRDRFLAASVNY